MPTKIQHAAIISENFVREARFFEAAFGMKRSKPGSEEEEKAIRTNYAVSVSDGYVGMTIIGRKPGYVPGLHHFGLDVDDVDEAIKRIKKAYPEVAVLKRPSNRPFATFGAHDPEGNYFDLTQEGMSNRRDVYTEQQREQPRRMHHIKLRVMNAPAMAAFYRDLFDLKEDRKSPRRSQLLSHRRQNDADHRALEDERFRRRRHRPAGHRAPRVQGRKCRRGKERASRAARKRSGDARASCQ